MLSWVCAIKHILVKFSSKVTSKAMNFSLLLFNDELNTIKLLHRSFFSLPIFLDFLFHLHIFFLWIGKMAECENLFSLFSTWVSCWKDSHYIRKFEGEELLGDWDSCLETLRSIGIDFIPTNLTGERHHIIRVRIWNEYASFFQEFWCGIQAFWTEFIISKRS